MRSAPNPDSEPSTAQPWPAARRVTVVLSALIVLALIVGIGALILPKVAESSANDDAGTRQTVLARASDFVTAFNTYSAAKPGDYQERVGSLMTDDFRKEFTKASAGFLKALKKKKQTSGDASVLGAAVDSIDGDSAEVIIAVDATIKNVDSKKPIPRHFRWRVSLERSGDTWKVSKYTPVSTNDSQQGGGASGPTPTPGKDEK